MARADDASDVVDVPLCGICCHVSSRPMKLVSGGKALGRSVLVDAGIGAVKASPMVALLHSVREGGVGPVVKTRGDLPCN